MEINNINSGYASNSINAAKSKATDNTLETKFKSVLENLDKKSSEEKEKELKKVCGEFEGMLMNTLYKQMKATINKSDLIPSSSGRDIFESMLDDKLVEEASKGNRLGLGDILYKQLSKQLKATYKPGFTKEQNE